MNVAAIKLALKDPKLGEGPLFPCLTAGRWRQSYQVKLSDSNGRTEVVLSDNLTEAVLRVFAIFEIAL